MRQKMIATKSFRYATRMLQAGDEVDMLRQDARLHAALRNVRPPDRGDTELDALRAEAEALGVPVDRRWKEKRLREEIERARHTDDGE